jgi:hypothetical protein
LPDQALPSASPRRRYGNMNRRFAARSETFGLETPEPWALDALRLLFNVPRVFEPLADAWDARHPGAKRTLNRLVEMGFAAYQPAIVVDVRSGAAASRRTRPVARYRATSSGRRLARAAAEDPRVVQDAFPKCTDQNAAGVAALLAVFDLDDLHGRTGVSAPTATERAGMSERTGRWWVRHLVEHGYLRVLDTRLGDTRELVPAHWRATLELARQLRAVLDAYPAPHGALAAELRLHRTRFLDPIDPARIGADGATDFDHDVSAQRVLAAMLHSPRTVPGASFLVEPRLVLTADDHTRPWTFRDGEPALVPWQPDAVLTERTTSPRRSVVEYERYQSRRDAWGHIERFLGYLSLRTLAFEPAVLRFVVDTEARLRSYVELIEAFADYAAEHPERMPGNAVTLAATTVERLVVPGDCLDDRRWHRIDLPQHDDGLPFGGACVLHDPASSPYDQYFSRQS